MLENTGEDANRHVVVLDANLERAERISDTLRILNYTPVTPRPEESLDALDKNAGVALMIGDAPAGDFAHDATEEFSRHNPEIPVLRVSGGLVSAPLERQLDKHHSWEVDAPLLAPQLEFLLKRARRYKGRERRVRLTGDSPSIKDVRKQIEKVADFDTTVLVMGESGTGKELVARTVHDLSERGGRPFVPINCGAIPPELLESELFGHEKGAFTGAVSARKGRFELADGGTLFLDEIGDMSLDMQAKVLRVLQERSFERVGGSETRHCDVRIIAATHRDLPERVRAGDFREDLYYRLNVFPVDMPPLRRRLSDLPALLDELLVEHGSDGRSALRLTKAALTALRRYPWPGNVRELSNLVERLAILHPTGKVDIGDLPARYREASSVAPDAAGANGAGEVGLNLRDRLQEVEKELIRSAMKEADEVVARAARLLNLRRTTLVEKLKKYRLQ